MLKFQNNNTTFIANFEDFILTVYVVIDDLYHQFALSEVIHRRHVLDAELSAPEIITISLCGELEGIDSENAWFSFVKKNYHHLFPQLCNRSRFNRTRRAMMQTTELCRAFCGYGADYGKCPSKKETYFGYKVHALITMEGHITTFEITLDSTDDREGLRYIVENRSDFVILGDKGCVGENLIWEMKEQGICLMD